MEKQIVAYLYIEILFINKMELYKNMANSSNNYATWKRYMLCDPFMSTVENVSLSIVIESKSLVSLGQAQGAGERT